MTPPPRAGVLKPPVDPAAALLGPAPPVGLVHAEQADGGEAAGGEAEGGEAAGENTGELWAATPVAIVLRMARCVVAAGM